MRLTMGGEPTFVSADNMDASEWNTEALGRDKRERAEELWRRLHVRFAPGGLAACRSRQVVPGEPLPRWALGIYWRSDGQPLWRNPAWLAAPAPQRDLRHTTADAAVFAQTLARTLGLHTSFIHAGYEDALYYLWQETKTPPDVDLGKARLADDAARRALAEQLSRGIDQAVVEFSAEAAFLCGSREPSSGSCCNRPSSLRAHEEFRRHIGDGP